MKIAVFSKIKQKYLQCISINFWIPNKIFFSISPFLIHVTLHLTIFVTMELAYLATKKYIVFFMQQLLHIYKKILAFDPSLFSFAFL